MKVPGDGQGQDQRRYERFEVCLPTRVQDAHVSFDATLVDVSEGGAAIQFDQPLYSNDQFVELHTAGYQTLHGRVVRQFQGGMALEFDDEEERKRVREEIAKFRAVVGGQREF
jgi:hypothetical protein